MADYTKAQLTEMIIGKLQRNFGRTVDEATPNHMFKACALVLRDIMSRRQMETDNHVWEGQQRQVSKPLEIMEFSSLSSRSTTTSGRSSPYISWALL